MKSINTNIDISANPINRRRLLKFAVTAAALNVAGCATSKKMASDDSDLPHGIPSEPSLVVDAPAHLARSLQLCADAYPVNRRKDMLSFTNKTNYRMTVSPVGYPVAICMCPDLTFGMLGSRYLKNRAYLDTFRGHLDHLPREMRRNGKFFINEDMLAGADRVLSQVMYPLWIWEIYRATGDLELLKFHHDPLKRCLKYIEGRTDARGIVTQVDPDDWQYSEGADWVDWCPERMEGSTCVYHTWYARALEGCVSIFRILEDSGARIMCEERAKRQRSVLDQYFWNGNAYWDNLNFQGEKVGRFWCDSQIWPIAYGYSSQEQAASIFARIDAEPEVFEGVPMRWCAPIAPGDEDPRYLPGGKYSDAPRPGLREYTWFGRLGAGDILARYQMAQNDHAYRLILRYAEVVSELGTMPECLDMQGKPRRGTNGGNNYLEHAGGYLWCVGKGLFGINDAQDGQLYWTPRFPAEIKAASAPFWHNGACWEFGCTQDSYWFDPHGASGEVQVTLNGGTEHMQADGKKISINRPPSNG